jgi:DNA-binding XRE family transcriptional regulator/quercetin dioxygenase-like cupin family protein
MTTESAGIAQHLARNVAALRAVRGMSQIELGKRAGVPRSTIANLESGDGNPSLVVLAKVARALEAPIDELIAPPRQKIRKYSPDQRPELAHTGRGVSLKPLVMGPSPHEMMAVMTLEKGGVMPGTPHLPGTREFFTLLEGEISIVVHGERFDLTPGELLAFPGNVAHGYQNLAKGRSVGVSVVLFSEER